MCVESGQTDIHTTPSHIYLYMKPYNKWGGSFKYSEMANSQNTMIFLAAFDLLY